MRVARVHAGVRCVWRPCGRAVCAGACVCNACMSTFDAGRAAPAGGNRQAPRCGARARAGCGRMPHRAVGIRDSSVLRSSGLRGIGASVFRTVFKVSLGLSFLIRVRYLQSRWDLLPKRENAHNDTYAKLFALVLGAHGCGVAAWHMQCPLVRCGLRAASKFTALCCARALVHVACKMLCNKLHKLVSNEWSKRKSMWDGARRFAIEEKRARSVILRSISCFQIHCPGPREGTRACRLQDAVQQAA